MGTKNNPGKFDCYAKADPDEPMFILLGRDPLAPSLVLMWACFANGDVVGALAEFNHVAQEILPQFEDKPTSEDKLKEAVACAEAMEEMQGLTEGLELPS